MEKVVIAACSPRFHGPTRQELLRRSGLNPAVVEVANIREQYSWVHPHEKAAGTHKALELIQMAIAMGANSESIGFQFHLIKLYQNLLQTEKANPTALPLTQAT